MTPPGSSQGHDSDRAPSPPATLLLGHAAAFRHDPAGFLLETARTCGPVARLRVGHLTYHLVSDPALVAEVLQDRATNYVRDTRSSRSIRLVTGESLLTSEGDTWRRHRRLAQPIFHQHRVAQLAQVMAACAVETAEAWERAAEEGQPLDLASEMSRLTFTAVGRCLFGADLGARAAAVENAFPILLEELFIRSQNPASFPIWMPLARHRRFQRALGTIDEIVTGLIETRRSKTAVSTDLLGLLLAARDDAGEGLSDDELRNQIVTFLLAGHETTASTLTWTLSLLARHAGAREAVEAELDRGRMATRLPVASESLAELVQLNAALQETLRLYPAIWIAERRVVAADRLGGFLIPADTSVIVAPYVTHRLAAHWPEPDAFQPTRWLGAEPRTLAQHGFFPFGAGPHACIGQHFALLEAKIILATLLSRFRLHLCADELPRMESSITLRPAGKVFVRVERRPVPRA